MEINGLLLLSHPTREFALGRNWAEGGRGRRNKWAPRRPTLGANKGEGGEEVRNGYGRTHILGGEKKSK